jgi:hypothetical protein
VGEVGGEAGGAEGEGLNEANDLIDIEYFSKSVFLCTRLSLFASCYGFFSYECCDMLGLH